MHEIVDLDGLNIARGYVSEGQRADDEEEILLTILGPGECFTLDSLEAIMSLHDLLTEMLKAAAQWPPRTPTE